MYRLDFWLLLLPHRPPAVVVVVAPIFYRVQVPPVKDTDFFVNNAGKNKTYTERPSVLAGDPTDSKKSVKNRHTTMDVHAWYMILEVVLEQAYTYHTKSIPFGV